ncbi:MAG TPA: S8 family peptidase [Herpetosiphonaceae bacterium]
MKRFAGLFVSALMLSVGVLASAPAAASATFIPAPRNAIADQYIVVLKDGAGANAGSVAADVGAHPKYVYDAALNGFAATLSQGQLRALQKHPRVAYIEQDQEVSIEMTQPVSGGQWGLDRIDQPNLPLNGTYVFNTMASNVTVYLLDTGIYLNHWEFGGRAAIAYDVLGTPNPGGDCNGNGTYQAGVIGSGNYGVAKGVQLRAVRVLDCNGAGTISGVIAGMNWIAANAVSPAVVNVTLGMGGVNLSVNNATTNMVNAGRTVVVSAGSSNADACNYSPASASGVLTIAASLSNDNRASFSNYGPCVELYAPGGSITTTSNTGGTNTISGTSLAASHTSGVAALYLAYNPAATPAMVNNWIISNATPGVIIGNPPNTPNRLLFKSNL